jgi:hypothetical protein
MDTKDTKDGLGLLSIPTGDGGPHFSRPHQGEAHSFRSRDTGEELSPGSRDELAGNLRNELADKNLSV